MHVEQFEDKNLAHFSYLIMSHGEIAIIDPARDPQPYYDFAQRHQARIVSIIETHPHADFVSSHVEIANKTKATIYVSRLLGAEYPHESFDDGDAILLGNVTLKAINTPGHSPDSISILALDENGHQKAIFTGDTLFIGDCGRPDLRETAGAITAARESLAKQMYHSLREKIMPLSDDITVYPAHGAGSLCGKGLSAQNSSTLGAEKMSNWSLQAMSEELFIQELLADQPFIPKYFTYDVALNKKGAPDFSPSISKVPVELHPNGTLALKEADKNIVIVDTRPQHQFKTSHFKNAINLMNDNKFETWLGSIINPGEAFFLIAESEQVIHQLIARIAKIGYESQIKLAVVSHEGDSNMPIFDSELLRHNEDAFTIVDIRNHSEMKLNKLFGDAIHIPLHELRERTNEIPMDKPIVVHCAGGYRSAAGSSLIKSKLNGSAVVYDLSEAVKSFKA